MSDEPRRRDSEKSRQELLDEIYLLRDVAGEREQRAGRLQVALDEARAHIERVASSRSWRLTAPLRWVSRVMVRLRRGAAGAETARRDSLESATASGAPKTADRAHRKNASAEDRSDGSARLYVDVTELAIRQGRTGVQRVTREILRALLDAPPPGFRVQPVCARPGQSYMCATVPVGRFASPLLLTEGARRAGESPDTRGVDRDRIPNVKGVSMAEVSLTPQSGDIFLGLDHAMDAVIANADQLASMREHGVRLWFVCNDVLPLARPDWFPPDVSPKFRTWLQTIARVGDGIACISRATESALRARLGAMDITRIRPIALAHFALGSDPVAEGDVPIPPARAVMVERLRGVPAFLMVGTLEPRKGHAQTLEAFNRLWSEGADVLLVVAGFPGWLTEVTQRRIRHHDEFGKRLFWFMDADDALLDALYRSCTALLAPSEGEGFGLPLVEAARHGLPILCRDLLVFREVAGEHAVYFTGLDRDSLANAIRTWLDDFHRGAVPGSSGMPRLGWAASAGQLLDCVVSQRVGASR